MDIQAAEVRHKKMPVSNKKITTCVSQTGSKTSVTLVTIKQFLIFVITGTFLLLLP